MRRRVGIDKLTPFARSLVVAGVQYMHTVELVLTNTGYEILCHKKNKEVVFYFFLEKHKKIMEGLLEERAEEVTVGSH